jgi:hypothetical protein
VMIGFFDVSDVEPSGSVTNESVKVWQMTLFTDVTS